MTEEGYNGWKNYETWLMNLNLTNEEGLYHSIIELLKETEGKKDYERAETLKDWVEEAFWVDEHNIIKICDTWTTRDFQEIDWIEIVKGVSE